MISHLYIYYTQKFISMQLFFILLLAFFKNNAIIPY